MSGAKACPINGHRHPPVEWTCGVPGRAAGQPSCRWIRRECDSGSDDSLCGNQILPEFEHSDHLGTHAVKGSNQARFER